jgi:hypothetical protein
LSSVTLSFETPFMVADKLAADRAGVLLGCARSFERAEGVAGSAAAAAQQ